MRLSWRREDWGYAAATTVAAVIVAYLIAANFGLVPSPLTPRGLDDAAAPTVPALEVLAASGTDDALGLSAPASLPTETPGSGSVGPPPAPQDRGPPEVATTTPDGLEATVTEAATVSGTASDPASGIKEVIVTFDPESGSTRRVTAALACNSSRTRCEWTADIPAVVGSFRVTAEARDRAGNEAATPPIEVTTVNVGSPVDQLTDDGPLAGVVDAIGGLLGL